MTCRLLAVLALVLCAGCDVGERVAQVSGFARPHLYACFLGARVDTVLGWYNASMSSDRDGPSIWYGADCVFAAYAHNCDSVLWLPRGVRVWPSPDSARLHAQAANRRAMNEALERDR